METENAKSEITTEVRVQVRVLIFHLGGNMLGRQTGFPPTSWLGFWKEGCLGGSVG